MEKKPIKADENARKAARENLKRKINELLEKTLYWLGCSGCNSTVTSIKRKGNSRRLNASDILCKNRKF